MSQNSTLPAPPLEPVGGSFTVPSNTGNGFSGGSKPKTAGISTSRTSTASTTSTNPRSSRTRRVVGGYRLMAGIGGRSPPPGTHNREVAVSGGGPPRISSPNAGHVSTSGQPGKSMGLTSWPQPAPHTTNTTGTSASTAPLSKPALSTVPSLSATVIPGYGKPRTTTSRTSQSTPHPNKAALVAAGLTISEDRGVSTLPADLDPCKRVPIWNVLLQKKISGFACPMRKNLKAYLESHPGCVVYERRFCIEARKRNGGKPKRQPRRRTEKKRGEATSTTVPQPRVDPEEQAYIQRMTQLKQPTVIRSPKTGMVPAPIGVRLPFRKGAGDPLLVSSNPSMLSGTAGGDPHITSWTPAPDSIDGNPIVRRARRRTRDTDTQGPTPVNHGTVSPSGPRSATGSPVGTGSQSGPPSRRGSLQAARRPTDFTQMLMASERVSGREGEEMEDTRGIDRRGSGVQLLELSEVSPIRIGSFPTEGFDDIAPLQLLPDNADMLNHEEEVAGMDDDAMFYKQHFARSTAHHPTAHQHSSPSMTSEAGSFSGAASTTDSDSQPPLHSRYRKPVGTGRPVPPTAADPTKLSPSTPVTRPRKRSYSDANSPGDSSEGSRPTSVRDNGNFSPYSLSRGPKSPKLLSGKPGRMGAEVLPPPHILMSGFTPPKGARRSNDTFPTDVPPTSPKGGWLNAHLTARGDALDNPLNSRGGRGGNGQSKEVARSRSDGAKSVSRPSPRNQDHKDHTARTTDEAGWAQRQWNDSPAAVYNTRTSTAPSVTTTSTNSTTTNSTTTTSNQRPNSGGKTVPESPPHPPAPPAVLDVSGWRSVQYFDVTGDLQSFSGTLDPRHAPAQRSQSTRGSLTTHHATTTTNKLPSPARNRNARPVAFETLSGVFQQSARADPHQMDLRSSVLSVASDVQVDGCAFPADVSAPPPDHMLSLQTTSRPSPGASPANSARTSSGPSVSPAQLRSVTPATARSRPVTPASGRSTPISRNMELPSVHEDVILLANGSVAVRNTPAPAKRRTRPTHSTTAVPASPSTASRFRQSTRGATPARVIAFRNPLKHR